MLKKYTIQIKPRAKNNKIEKVEAKAAKGSSPDASSEAFREKNLKVWIKAPAKEGKANAELIKTLAKYFSVPQSSINILKGHKSKTKIISINT